MKNATLLTADRATHVKIVAVALALATLVSGIALTARVNVAHGQGDAPSLIATTGHSAR
jgi:hypothetical protein